MKKNKGSFWKNNIKKIKKERKERSKKAKIALIRKEKTVSNELQSIVTDNEKKKKQILQELEDISQEPVYCKLLLDTNFIIPILLSIQ